MRIALAAFSLMPRSKNFTLVTRRSSPTSCVGPPSDAVIFFHPSQSSSARPSSIEGMGYFFWSEPYHAIISSEDNFFPSHASVYFPSEKNSDGAQSSANTTSVPSLYPAFPIASEMRGSASSLPPFTFGANPPSSPTVMPYPFSVSTFLSAWNTSASARTASRNVGTPTGAIINSLISVDSHDEC